MIALFAGGRAVDLYADTSLSFTADGLKSAEDMSLNRSQEFRIPLTAKNAGIFGFPFRPDFYGANVRQRYATTLVYDGGTITGSLSVTDCTETEICAAFVYGELADLEAVRNGGKLADIISVQDAIYLRPGAYFYEYERKFGLASYFNGYNTDTVAGLRLPCVKVGYLLDKLKTQAGVPMDGTLEAAAGDSMGIILNTLNGGDTENVGGTLDCYMDGEINHTADIRNPYPVLTAERTKEGTTLGEWLVPITEIIDYGFTSTSAGRAEKLRGSLYCLQVMQPCRVALMGNNKYKTITEPRTGVFLARGVSKSNNGIPIQVTLTPSEVAAAVTASTFAAAVNISLDCEAGDLIFYARKTETLPAAWRRIYATSYNRPFLIAPATGSCFAGTFSVKVARDTLTLQKDTTGYFYGAYVLQDNLPDVTAVELMRAVAQAAGGVLTYTPGAGFGVFRYEFDDAAAVALDGELIEVVSVRREVSGKGRTIFRGLMEQEGWTYSKSYSPRVTYAVPNGTLSGETYEGSETVAGAPSRFFNGFDYAAIQCAETAEYTDGETKETVTGLKELDAPVIVKRVEYATGTPYRAEPWPVPASAAFAEICRMSTCAVVRVHMPLYKWMALTPVTPYSFRGGKWYAVEMTWSDGVAEMTLQRYA